MKIGTHFTRYMAAAASVPISLSGIETEYDLTHEEIVRALDLMRMLGAVQSFSIEQGDIRASLNLTLLQRARTLEIRQKSPNLT